MSTFKAEKNRIEKLRALVAHHHYLYHTADAPVIDDEVFDSLSNELKALEIRLEGKKSPITEAVGSDVNEAFSKVTHANRQWSFDKAFTFAELQDWMVRLHKLITEADVTVHEMTYISEHKIDGLKLILTYRDGQLVQAVTRGDGVVGEDVTHTARTISDIHHSLSFSIDITVVGEVWLPEKEFMRINNERKKNDEALFANPRNAAAGSLRQLDPEITKSRNLAMYCYDIDALDVKKSGLTAPESQKEELELLTTLGFSVNKHATLCRTQLDIEKYYSTWAHKRASLPYGIDGIVLKVNDISTQTLLGYTAKAPRFGIALKFPATQVTTLVESIELQVGRTGVITPVACLTPVLVDGSMVARATLHNEDQIARLDIRVGDTIVLQKAGDIIPEVVEIVKELRPSGTKPYRFPKKIAECGGDGSIERIPGEVAYRCVVLDSAFLHVKRLHYFVSKAGLNIDGVGPRIIDQLVEAGLIKEAPELFTLKSGDIAALPGFKQKAADNVVLAIKNARTQTLARFITALGIDNVGEETARIITQQFHTLESLLRASVTQLAVIHGVGDIVATSLVNWFADAKNKELVIKLQKFISFSNPTSVQSQSNLQGKTFVLTGTLSSITRDEAKEQIRVCGGTVTNSISKKTDYLVVGENPGSKVEEATKLGVSQIDETAFKALLASL